MSTTRPSTTPLYQAQDPEVWTRLREVVVAATPASSGGKQADKNARRRIASDERAQHQSALSAMAAMHQSASTQQQLEAEYGVPVTLLVGLPEVPGDTWRRITAHAR